MEDNKPKNETQKKFELTYEELYNLISEGYRHGYATFEMVDAGLERYDADGYTRWELFKLEKDSNNLGELEKQYNKVKDELTKLQDLFMAKIETMKSSGVEKSSIRRLEDNTLQKLNEVLNNYFEDNSSEIKTGCKIGDRL